jgi:hypothetical protein
MNKTFEYLMLVAGMPGRQGYWLQRLKTKKSQTVNLCPRSSRLLYTIQFVIGDFVQLCVLYAMSPDRNVFINSLVLRNANIPHRKRYARQIIGGTIHPDHTHF